LKDNFDIDTLKNTTAPKKEDFYVFYAARYSLRNVRRSFYVTGGAGCPFTAACIP
jgi:hypothetical protein